MKEEIRKYIIENLEIDDDDTIKELMDMFVESINENMGKLESAIASGDCGESGSVAHGLKGAAANIGAIPVFEVAKRCELTFKSGNFEEGKKIFEELKAVTEAALAELS